MGPFTWHKTWQPVTMDDWTHDLAAIDRFSTVMTWKIESFTDVGGNKDQEFVKFIDLPSRTPQHFELAVNGPQKLLREHGWATVDAMGVSTQPVGLPRVHSTLEGGVRCRQTHLRLDALGWFSDRTECYLAAGRPALVQDTGWSAHLPEGIGLLAFSNPEEALAGVARASTPTTPRTLAAHVRLLPSTSPPTGAAATARRMQPLRIAHVAPVATSIPPSQIRLRADDDVAADGGPGRAGDITSRCSHLATPLSATLHATFPKGYWHDGPCGRGKCAIAEPRGRCRARIGVRRHPLRSRLLPDVDGVHACRRRRSPRPFITPRASQRLRCGSAIRTPPFVAISNEQARLLEGLNVVDIVPHGIDTDRFTFNATAGTTSCFLAASRQARGPVQAIEVAKRAGMRLLLAAAEDQCYLRACRTARRWNTGCLCR